MIYETAVRSFPRLMNELQNLDADAGIRVEGEYNRRKCFVFVTRSFVGYTAMVYRKTVPVEESGRLMAHEFRDLKELELFLRGTAARPLKAYIY